LLSEVGVKEILGEGFCGEPIKNRTIIKNTNVAKVGEK